MTVPTLEERLREIEATVRAIREERGYENVVLLTRCGCRREISIATGCQFVCVPMHTRLDVSARPSPRAVERRFSYRGSKAAGDKRVFEED